MQTILRDERVRILRFDRGEELITSLQSFCEKEEITAGTLSAIGAAEHLVLSWYDVSEKKYTDQERSEQLEIASLSGNISSFKGKPIVHVHGSRSRSAQARSGRDPRRCSFSVSSVLARYGLLRVAEP